MKLNLINKEISEIKYDVTRFPDGEPQFFLTEELNRKESIDVICRISNTGIYSSQCKQEIFQIDKKQNGIYTLLI